VLEMPVCIHWEKKGDKRSHSFLGKDMFSCHNERRKEEGLLPPSGLHHKSGIKGRKEVW